MKMEEGRPDRLTLAAFTILVVVGGGNAVAIRFSNRELPPFWGATIRFAVASLLFFLILAIFRLPLPVVAPSKDPSCSESSATVQPSPSATGVWSAFRPASHRQSWH